MYKDIRHRLTSVRKSSAHAFTQECLYNLSVVVCRETAILLHNLNILFLILQDKRVHSGRTYIMRSYLRGQEITLHIALVSCPNLKKYVPWDRILTTGQDSTSAVSCLFHF